MDFKILLDPRKAEGHPVETILIGFVYSFLGVLLSRWIFPAYSSIAMLALTVAACVPLMFLILNYEEQQDRRIKKEFALLKQHSKALFVFTFLFLGFILGFLTWFVILPANDAYDLFEAQSLTILHINKHPASGYAYAQNFSFTVIFLNNLRVLGFILLFSLIFSAGAVLILAWNASIIATAIGSFAIAQFNSQAHYAILDTIANTAGRYLLHSVPEVMGFITAGIAGGIIYIALVRQEFTKRVIIDSALLLAASLVFIFLGAVLEVAVTPNFY